jgi:hypothetical protein
MDSVGGRDCTRAVCSQSRLLRNPLLPPACHNRKRKKS